MALKRKALLAVTVWERCPLHTQERMVAQKTKNTFVVDANPRGAFRMNTKTSGKLCIGGPLQICCQRKKRNDKWLDSAVFSAKNLHPGIRRDRGRTIKRPPLVCAFIRLKWNLSTTRYDQSYPYYICRPSKWFGRGWNQIQKILLVVTEN